jgi:hypothetical protein
VRGEDEMEWTDVKLARRGSGQRHTSVQAGSADHLADGVRGVMRDSARHDFP